MVGSPLNPQRQRTEVTAGHERMPVSPWPPTLAVRKPRWSTEAMLTKGHSERAQVLCMALTTEMPLPVLGRTEHIC